MRFERISLFQKRGIPMKRRNIFLMMLMILNLMGCTQTKGDIAGNSNQGIIKEENKSEEKINNVEKEPAIYEDEIKKIHDASKRDSQAKVEYENIIYEVKDIEFGKQIGEHEKEAINYWNEQVDSEGNLLGDEQYIWLKLKMVNLLKKKQTVLVNYPIVSIDSDNTVVETGAEARYIMPEEQEKETNERFHCNLDANEEVEVEIGYIISEENVSAPIYFCLGDSGAAIDNPNNIFIYLGELVDEK